MLWKWSVCNRRNWRHKLQAADAISRERRRLLLAGYPTLAVSTVLAAIIVTFCLAFPAASHEREHPELNAWYEGLRRPHGLPCCSRRDCHRTDAELRQDGWYARLGVPVYSEANNGQEVPQWRLIDPPIHISENLIVKDSRGRPVSNPEGEAVICHDATLINGKADVNPTSTVVWCFVPPGEF